MPKGDAHQDLCECRYCSLNTEFEMPRAVVDAARAGDLVVFAGAGVSTETPLVFPDTLYERIVHELGDDATPDMSFPAVMQAFEAREGRVALLDQIKRRLDYARSFPALDGPASRFHRELSALYMVRDIFTTNWDDYFERECAASPFVTEQDWAFWATSQRKVFKIHGSISSPGSVIATTDDYDECYRGLNEGLVGATLKSMLATKVVVFFGYSFRDSDFTALYSVLQKRMGKLMPRAYVVTIDEAEPPEMLTNAHVIRTDATYFLGRLKQEFSENELIPDERFEGLRFIRDLVGYEHRRFIDRGDMSGDGEKLLCASYQDGLIDAFDRMLANLASGEYHDPHALRHRAMGYDAMRSEKKKAGAYADLAYIEGYLNGLVFLLGDDEFRDSLPLYYVAGSKRDLVSYKQYKKAAKKARKAKRKSHVWATAQANRLAPGIVYQHTPFL